MLSLPVTDRGGAETTAVGTGSGAESMNADEAGIGVGVGVAVDRVTDSPST